MTDRKKRILIATDGSDFSKHAIEEACEYMKPHATEVVCMSTYENPVPVAVDPAFVSNAYYGQIMQTLVDCADAYVAEAEKLIRRHFTAEEVPVRKLAVNGFADKELIEEAKKWEADLIVVGSHGRGFWGRLLGSVSNAVVHHAPCSVLVVKKSV